MSSRSERAPGEPRRPRGRPPTLGADRRIAARLDAASEEALDALTADGTSETDAIRAALISAAKRRSPAARHPA